MASDTSPTRESAVTEVTTEAELKEDDPMDGPGALTTPTDQLAALEPELPHKIGGTQFWLILSSLMVATFLSALDFTSVANTLPTIVKDLEGENFVWIGGAFALGSTAFLPLSGGLAQVFGRRPVVLGSVSLFALGSGICGGASSMNMLIAGRAVQGIGGGGILSLTEIVVGDLVPLHKRGPYIGLISSVWAVASAIGPPVGGAFAEGNWRWLFYLNLPISGIALVLIFFFFHMKVPQEDFRTKMKRMDWIGNLLVVVSTTITVIALTWAGTQYPWSSYQVLVPLVLGLIGLAAFFVYEFKWAKEPVVPWRLVANRTSVSGYATVFLHGLIMTTLIYYGPIFFQASLMQSPLRAGISFFPNCFTIAPGAFICGISIALFHVYRPQNIIGWILLTVGMGLLTLATAHMPKAKWVGYQIVEGFGIGILFSSPKFPILAPVPVNESAHALAFFIFVRSYAQTWGVTIGATILQNELKRRLPPLFLSALPSNIEIAFASIPSIRLLPEPLRTEVREAFADSLRVVWITMTAISGAGFIAALFMKELPMHRFTDKDWGLKDRKKKEASADIAAKA